MKRAPKEKSVISRRLLLIMALDLSLRKRNPHARGRFRKHSALSGTRVGGQPLRHKAADLSGREQLAEFI